MQLYDIVKLKSGPENFGQITSDGQDHGKFARLYLEAPLEVTLRNGLKKRVKLKETDADVSNTDRWAFIAGNPHYLP